MIRRPPSSPLFPSPPLFRSERRGARRAQSGRHHAPLPSRRQPVSDPPGVQVPLPDLTEEPATEPLLRVAGRQLPPRSEEHTSELQSQSNLVCRLLLEK